MSKDIAERSRRVELTSYFADDEDDDNKKADEDEFMSTVSHFSNNTFHTAISGFGARKHDSLQALLKRSVLTFVER
jgi:hypothetical protein